ncbi:MAG: ankyrin repeat domain-containing protein, partial [Verrucomicrobiae bacterium]|nr:ankyrin repeat domain-containing protein [Verrucomicrobiae bacterium]
MKAIDTTKGIHSNSSSRQCWLVCTIFALGWAAVSAQEEPQPPGDSIEQLFRDALYAEEVKGDVAGALKTYQQATERFERQRDLAATALYRQGECLRKLNRPEEAAACYQRILSHYADQERIAKLSRENLTALGQSLPDVETALAPTPSDPEDAEIARLEEMLRNSPDLLNTPSGDTPPPLHVAAENGQVKVVEFLIGKGADVNGIANGRPPLHRAAEAGHLAVCEMLIEAGADVNAECKEKGSPHYGQSSLVAALANQRMEVVSLLLNRKADPNVGFFTIVPENDSRYAIRASALAIACRAGKPELTRQLIRAGADVNKINSWNKWADNVIRSRDLPEGVTMLDL